MNYRIETSPWPVSSFDWYVACVEHGKEAAAADHLKAVGFTDTFVPLVLSETIPRRNRPPRTNPLRSGYVFCEMQLFTPSIWHLACPADGLRYHGLVKGFLGGWPAAPVANTCIEDMRSRCDINGLYIKIEVPVEVVTYKPGDLVIVAGGAADGMMGIVDRANDHGVWITPGQTANFTLFISRGNVKPFLETRTGFHETRTGPVPRSIVTFKTGAPIGKPVSEARTKRTRRGFRKVRSCAA